MRKIVAILLVVVMVTAIAVPAMAAEPRAITIVPDLSFNGNVATCNVRMVANNITDELHATVRLYRGSALLATWTAEGNGYIFFNKTKTVAPGYLYKLTVDLTVNGVACSQVYVHGNC